MTDSKVKGSGGEPFKQLPTVQKETSFKQLTVLRKALTESHTGEIIYEREDGEGSSLHVTVGDLLDDKVTMCILEELLTSPVANCELKSEHFDKTLEDKVPPEVFSKVMNNIHWNQVTLNSLKKTFEKLPAIDVRMVPMHKYGYHDGLTYLSLYHESLKDKEFSPKKYLENQNAFTTLEQQMKALVLGYCLGLIKPSKAKATAADGGNQKPVSRRTSMAARILEKMRGKS